MMLECVVPWASALAPSPSPLTGEGPLAVSLSNGREGEARQLWRQLKLRGRAG